MSRKFCVNWSWRAWTFGIVFPHGGMIVWSLCLGPLSIQFWPLAGSNDEVPF